MWVGGGSSLSLVKSTFSGNNIEDNQHSGRGEGGYDHGAVIEAQVRFLMLGTATFSPIFGVQPVQHAVEN